MANITVDSSAVRMTKEIDSAFKHTTMCGVAINRGQLIKLDTNGKWDLADQDDVGVVATYFSINDGAVNFPVTGIQKGTVDLGLSALSGVAYGAAIYATATAGNIADSGTAIIGYVTGVNAESPYGKLLDVNTVK